MSKLIIKIKMINGKKNKFIILGLIASIYPLSYAQYEFRYSLDNIKFVESDGSEVPVALKPEIELLTSDVLSLELSSSFLLTWQVKNATRTYIKGNNNSSGIDSGYTEIYGNSVNITPILVGSYTYNLKIINENGVSVDKNITITVIPYNYPEPIITSFQSQSTNVFVDSPFTLNWNVQNSNTIELKSNSSSSVIPTNYTTVIGQSKTFAEQTEGTYQYSIKATNLDNEETEKDLTILVEESPTIENLVANPSRFRLGQSTNLRFEGSSGLNYLINGKATPITGNNYSYKPTESGFQSISLKGSKTLNDVTKDDTKTVQIEVIPNDFNLSSELDAGETEQIRDEFSTISSSILNQGEGSVSGISIQVANHLNTLNYSMTMTACAGSNCVSSPTYNTLTMKDNLMNLFSFNSPLIVGKGQTIQYNIQMVNLGF